MVSSQGNNTLDLVTHRSPSPSIGEIKSSSRPKIERDCLTFTGTLSPSMLSSCILVLVSLCYNIKRFAVKPINILRFIDEFIFRSRVCFFLYKKLSTRKPYAFVFIPTNSKDRAWRPIKKYNVANLHGECWHVLCFNVLFHNKVMCLQQYRRSTRLGIGAVSLPLTCGCNIRAPFAQSSPSRLPCNCNDSQP